MMKTGSEKQVGWSELAASGRGLSLVRKGRVQIKLLSRARSLTRSLIWPLFSASEVLAEQVVVCRAVLVAVAKRIVQ